MMQALGVARRAAACLEACASHLLVMRTSSLSAQPLHDTTSGPDCGQCGETAHLGSKSSQDLPFLQPASACRGSWLPCSACAPREGGAATATAPSTANNSASDVNLTTAVPGCICHQSHQRQHTHALTAAPGQARHLAATPGHQQGQTINSSHGHQPCLAAGLMASSRTTELPPGPGSGLMAGTMPECRAWQLQPFLKQQRSKHSQPERVSAAGPSMSGKGLQQSERQQGRQQLRLRVTSQSGNTRQARAKPRRIIIRPLRGVKSGAVKQKPSEGREVQGLLHKALGLLEQGPQTNQEELHGRQRPLQVHNWLDSPVQQLAGTSHEPVSGSWEQLRSGLSDALKKHESQHRAQAMFAPDVIQFLRHAPQAIFRVWPTDRGQESQLMDDRTRAAVGDWPQAAVQLSAELLGWLALHLQSFQGAGAKGLWRQERVIGDGIRCLEQALGTRAAARLLGRALLDKLAAAEPLSRKMRRQRRAARNLQEKAGALLAALQAHEEFQRRSHDLLQRMVELERSASWELWDGTSAQLRRSAADPESVLDLGMRRVVQEMIMQLPAGQRCMATFSFEASARTGHWQILGTGSKRDRTPAVMLQLLLQSPVHYISFDLDDMAMTLNAAERLLGAQQAGRVLSRRFLNAARLRGIKKAEHVLVSSALISHGGLGHAIQHMHHMYCPPSSGVSDVSQLLPYSSSPASISLGGSGSPGGGADSRAAESLARPGGSPEPPTAAAQLPAWMPALGMPVGHLLALAPSQWQPLHQQQVARTEGFWGLPEAQVRIQRLLSFRPAQAAGADHLTQAWLQHNWTPVGIVAVAAAAERLQGCRKDASSGKHLCLLAPVAGRGNEQEDVAPRARRRGNDGRDSCPCQVSFLKEVHSLAMHHLAEFSDNQLAMLLAALKQPQRNLASVALDRLCQLAPQMSLTTLAAVALTLCFPDLTLLATLEARTRPGSNSAQPPDPAQTSLQQACPDSTPAAVLASVRVALGTTLSSLYQQQLAVLAGASHQHSQPWAPASSGAGEDGEPRGLLGIKPATLPVVLRRYRQHTWDQHVKDLGQLCRLLEEVASSLPLDHTLDVLASVAKYERGVSQASRLGAQTDPSSSTLTQQHSTLVKALLGQLSRAAARILVKNRRGDFKSFNQTYPMSERELRYKHVRLEGMLVEMAAALTACSVLEDDADMLRCKQDQALQLVLQCIQRLSGKMSVVQLGACLTSLSISRLFDDQQLKRLRTSLQERVSAASPKEVVDMLAALLKAGAVQQGLPVSAGRGSSRVGLSSNMVHSELLDKAAQLVSAGATELSPELAAAALVSLAGMGYTPSIAAASRRDGDASGLDVYNKLCDHLLASTSEQAFQQGAPPGAPTNSTGVLALPLRQIVPVIEAMVCLGMSSHPIIEAAANTVAWHMEATDTSEPKE